MLKICWKTRLLSAPEKLDQNSNPFSTLAVDFGSEWKNSWLRKKYFLLILWGWKWRFEKYILGCDCWLKICLTSRSMSSSMISWLRRAPLGTGHTLTTSPEPNTNILTYFSQKTRSLETVVQFSLSIDSKLTRYWADFHGLHPDLTPTLADCLCEDHRPWKRFSGELNRLINCTCFCHHPQFDFYKGIEFKMIVFSLGEVKCLWMRMVRIWSIKTKWYLQRPSASLSYI